MVYSVLYICHRGEAIGKTHMGVAQQGKGSINKSNRCDSCLVAQIFE